MADISTIDSIVGEAIAALVNDFARVVSTYGTTSETIWAYQTALNGLFELRGRLYQQNKDR